MYIIFPNLDLQDLSLKLLQMLLVFMPHASPPFPRLPSSSSQRFFHDHSHVPLPLKADVIVPTTTC